MLTQQTFLLQRSLHSIHSTINHAIIRDVHETFPAETRDVNVRDRDVGNCVLDETLWVWDETETKTLQVAETFGEKQ